MMKYIYIMLSILVFLVACQSKDAVMIEKEHDIKNTLPDPQLVEDNIDNDNKITMIEFPLKDEKMILSLDMFPILKNYIQTAEDSQEIIKEMDITPLKLVNKDLFLLSFSCKKGECSYMLIKRAKKNSGLLLSDASHMATYILSPNEDKLLLQFNHLNDDSTTSSDITVVDLNNWKIKTLKKDDKHVFKHFEKTILSVSWIDNESITVHIPNFKKGPTVNLKQWQDIKEYLDEVTYHIVE